MVSDNMYLFKLTTAMPTLVRLWAHPLLPRKFKLPFTFSYVKTLEFLSVVIQVLKAKT